MEDQEAKNRLAEDLGRRIEAMIKADNLDPADVEALLAKGQSVPSARDVVVLTVQERVSTVASIRRISIGPGGAFGHEPEIVTLDQTCEEGKNPLEPFTFRVKRIEIKGKIEPFALNDLFKALNLSSSLVFESARTRNVDIEIDFGDDPTRWPFYQTDHGLGMKGSGCFVPKLLKFSGSLKILENREEGYSPGVKYIIKCKIA